MQAALDGMGIMGGSIARAGTTNVNAVAGLTITVTRLTLNDVGSQGARWTVMPFDGLRTAAGFVGLRLGDNNGSAQVGIAPGNYNVVLYVPSFSRLTITNKVTILYRRLISHHRCRAH